MRTSPSIVSFEIVPPELLARPFRDEARRLERDASALRLDPFLRRLASQDARCRRVLGTLAGEFLRRQAHHALGFARVGDYARERLGFSARELQSLARTVGALRSLPALATAFERGALSWTQVRLLAPVATRETEQAWLALATGRTVRALEALLRSRNARTTGTESTGSASTVTVTARPFRAGAACDLDAALDDYAENGQRVEGEPEATFRVRCPRWVPPLWREVVELARRVAGEQLPIWRAAEAIAAEGLAAPELHALPPPGSRAALPPGWRAAPPESLVSPVPSRDSSSHGRGPSSGGAPPSDSNGRSDALIGGAADGRSTFDPNETHDAFTARSGLDTIDWSLVAEALPADVAALADDVADCDAHALDARMCTVAKALRSVDWQLGRLLRLFRDCRLHEVFGFASWERYVRERLGISTSAARLLVALERRTWTSPALMEAYRGGSLSMLRAFTIAPVVSESSGTAWVERADRVTLRRLTDEVGWALDVRDACPSVAVGPPALGVRLVSPARQMRAPLDEDLAAEIVVRGPASVVTLLRNTVATFHPPLTPSWTGLVRLLAHARAEWERLPRHRDPIFARDGWRCAVPACSSRRNLHDHHILFRSRGGENGRDNRVAVCAWHHLRGIHAGRVRAWGSAPDAVHWELGVRRGEAPLLRFVGDAYEETAAFFGEMQRAHGLVGTFA